MTYREPGARPLLEGSVTHGPFPVRWVAILFAIGGLLVGSVCTFVALGSDSFVCPPKGTCAVTRSRPPTAGEAVVFDRSELLSARHEKVVGSKGSVSGKVVLVLAGERERALMTTEAAAAERMANDVNAAIASHRAIDVTVRGDTFVGLFGAGALALAMWALVALFRNAGRTTLTVVRGGAALVVRRKIAWLVPLGAREVPLDAVADVVVESREIDDFWTPKGLKTSVGRLVLVTRDGVSIPLSERFSTGKTLHYRAAAALRAVLGLEPVRGGVEETLAKIPLVVTPFGSRFGFGWAGFCTGLVFGPLVTLGFGAATDLMPRLPGGAIDEAWFLPGMGLGAVVGVAIAIYKTRPRLPD